MQFRWLIPLVPLVACVDPETDFAECSSRYSDEVAIEMCVSNTRADRSERMARVSESLSRLSTGPQTSAQYGPALGGTSALTVRASQLCPMRYGYAFLSTSTVSGMNRICFYK
jgi:hypothetical protein